MGSDDDDGNDEDDCGRVGGDEDVDGWRTCMVKIVSLTSTTIRDGGGGSDGGGDDECGDDNDTM